MPCEELVRMREKVRQLRDEAARGLTHARSAERNDRRSHPRGGSNATVYMHRRLHRAMAKLQEHIMTHGCQE